MIIIADKRIPNQAKKNLKKYGEVYYLSNTGITYPAISGHPDIFFCQSGNQLVVAPNVDPGAIDYIEKNGITFVFGQKEIGKKYPETSGYNAVVSNNYVVHNKNFTDPEILKQSKQKEFIHVNQAYTRCNLVPLKNDRFITSDRGIEKAILQKGLKVLYFDPERILLEGFDHGFVGGTCGVVNDSIFFIGSLNHLLHGESVKTFLSGYKVIELYDGPLFDGGSLLFI